MKTKWMAAGIALLLGLTVFNVAYGAQTLSLIIKGQRVQSAIPPKIENGRTYVPLRVVTDYLNEDIHWDPKTQSVTVHPDVWNQDLSRILFADQWAMSRNTVTQFLMDFDEKDQDGKKLVSTDFDTNIIGPEVVIPFAGVGTQEGKMIDYKFIDAKLDQAANLMTIRVKIWWWDYKLGEYAVKTWDFTLDLANFSDQYNMYPQIKKIWQVREAKIDSHTVLPGLSFKNASTQK